jgi:hypothetical protein
MQLITMVDLCFGFHLRRDHADANAVTDMRHGFNKETCIGFF